MFPSLYMILPSKSFLQTGTLKNLSLRTGQLRKATTDGSNILIAYFTAANNSGVDAVASASVSTIDGVPMGRVEAIARMIQDNTDGDLFSIQTSVVYPADGGELIDYAAEEQDENARSELTSHIENFDQYDVVFVGYPWWSR